MIIRFLPKYLYAAAASVFLFAVGWVRARHRFLIYQIATHFGFPADDLARQLLPLAISELLPGELQPRLHALDKADGNVTLLELTVLAESVRRHQPRKIFEIGTFDGRTTLNLAANAPSNSQIYTLDLPRADLNHTSFQLDRGESAFVNKPRSGSWFVNHPLAARISQLYGDSATFDFTPYLGTIDFLFIDGSHAYDYVISDTRTALKLLNPHGGTIFWHDYQPDWPGVIRGLEELQKTSPALKNLHWIGGTTLVSCSIPALDPAPKPPLS